MKEIILEAYFLDLVNWLVEIRDDPTQLRAVQHMAHDLVMEIGDQHVGYVEKLIDQGKHTDIPAYVSTVAGRATRIIGYLQGEL